jgi:putative membrane protein
MKITTVATALAIAVAGYAVTWAQMPSRPAQSPAPTAQIPAHEYVQKAAWSDMFEIQSAQIAGARFHDSRIQQYARMMIDDHTKSTTQLTTIVSKLNIVAPLPYALDPEHGTQVERLRAAPGRDFDRLYLNTQIDEHQKALQLHRNYVQFGDTPTLKEFANTMIPVVQLHLDQAKQVTQVLMTQKP